MKTSGLSCETIIALPLDGMKSGDLTDIAKDVKGKEAIKDILLSQGMGAIAAGKAAQQLFYFRWTIAPGDLVLASNGATVLGVGRVAVDTHMSQRVIFLIVFLLSGCH